MIEIDSDLKLAIAAARRAGEVTLSYFGTDLDVRMKGVDQPLTEADLAADALLHQDLIGSRPGYGWLSEESTDSPDRLGLRRVWIVDPIDGTRSFVARRAEYSVSVGLADDGAVVAGVVYNPPRDEMFYASRGGGAWLQERDRPPRRLTLSDGAARRLLASRSEIAAGELDPFSGDWTIQPQGSTAYKLALVAAGEAEAFVSRGPKSEWDICAGVLIVDEAGGMATDVNGEEVSFNRADPQVNGIVCAAPVLHAALLEQVAALPPTLRVRRE